MRDDRYARQLARMEELHRRNRQRLEAKAMQMDKRFERARQRATSTEAAPSDDQQRIINAALELLDEVGINELSLRKLATKLDRKAPAIYWYFRNKSVLIDYMAESILQSEFKNLMPMQDDGSWQDWLVDVCKRLRSAMRSRRDGARIVAGAHLYPAITLIRIMEASQETLISAGVDPRQADVITTTAVHLTFGRVIEEQSSPEPEDLSNIELELVRREFPRVADSIKRTIDDNKQGFDEFDACLRLIIGYPVTAYTASGKLRRIYNQEKGKEEKS